jgi:3-isopropylmalate/(R)-2-methylmalate dehydratase large subunit
MTLTERIIARHSGRDAVRPDEIVTASVDLCMANDGTMRLNVDIFENKIGATRVFDPERIVLIMDHQVPADSPQTAEVHEISRRFAEKYGIRHFYESEGICHQVMIEKHVEPGMLVVGADSHTNSYGVVGSVSCGMGSTDISAVMALGKTWLRVPHSVRVELIGKLKPSVVTKDIILALIRQTTCSGLAYRAVEFTGPALADIPVPQRFTLCNMTTETGAKSSMIVPDDATYAYLRERRGVDITRDPLLVSDPDAVYEQTYTIDCSSLDPQVARPHSVDNVVPVGETAGVRIDQAFLGACTNARIEDLRQAADIIRGRKIASNVRFLVTPASRTVYLESMREGLIETFMSAGAIISHPGCSACWGACQGVLASGQTMISTGNRNFKGRAGSGESNIYLASPATVAASAVTGVITDPREFL